MVGRSMAFRNPAGHAGLFQTLRALVASLTQFLESRLQLAARESKAAVRHLVTLVACLIAAAVLSIFGYVFLIVFVIFEVARWIGVSWIWVALGLALLHFVAALFCLIIARGQSKHLTLRDTASVLKEDTEWLKNLDPTKRR
jgi:uncharacterized membrane protein YqjE